MVVPTDGRVSELPAPALLTVEEAGGLLRIGRTKAYAMAREWRATGGRSGLPVVDFGHVLRVPLRALEELIGAELTNFPNTNAQAAPKGRQPTRIRATAEIAPTPRAPAHTTASPRTATRRTRRDQTQPPKQLDLFQPKPPTS